MDPTIYARLQALEDRLRVVEAREPLPHDTYTAHLKTLKPDGASSYFFDHFADPILDAGWIWSTAPTHNTIEYPSHLWVQRSTTGLANILERVVPVGGDANNRAVTARIWGNTFARTGLVLYDTTGFGSNSIYIGLRDSATTGKKALEAQIYANSVLVQDGIIVDGLSLDFYLLTARRFSSTNADLLYSQDTGAGLQQRIHVRSGLTFSNPLTEIALYFETTGTALGIQTEHLVDWIVFWSPDPG